MASPEAASVVEQLNVLANSGTHTLIDNMDLRALLAVVEAAKEYANVPRQAKTNEDGLLVFDYRPQQAALKKLDEALDALYTPASAEERSGSKDAEGAKP